MARMWHPLLHRSLSPPLSPPLSIPPIPNNILALCIALCSAVQYYGTHISSFSSLPFFLTPHSLSLPPSLARSVSAPLTNPTTLPLFLFLLVRPDTVYMLTCCRWRSSASCTRLAETSSDDGCHGWSSAQGDADDKRLRRRPRHGHRPDYCPG